MESRQFDGTVIKTGSLLNYKLDLNNHVISEQNTESQIDNLDEDSEKQIPNNSKLKKKYQLVNDENEDELSGEGNY